MPTIDDLLKAQSSGGGMGSTPTSPGSPLTVSPSLASLFSTTTGERIPGTDVFLVKRRAPYTIAIIFGKSGTGKTSIVTGHYDDLGNLVGGVPDPFLLIDMDNRSYDRVVEAIEAGQRAYYTPAALPADILEMDNDAAKEFATQALARIKHSYRWAIAEAKRDRNLMRFIVIDGINELGDLIKLAVRGRVDRPAGTKEDKGDFGKSDAVINWEMRYYANAAREACVNLIMVARATQVYKGREATGEWTWGCDKIFDQACDWSAEVRLTDVETKIANATAQNGGKALSPMDLINISRAGPSFELVVDKAGNNIKEKGKVYSQEDWEREGVGPFAYAATRLMPRTSMDDWR